MRTTNPVGFTLIELMAAIGLIVVLTAGLATVFHREGNAGVALRTARRELVSALSLAQATARARQVPVRLCLLAAPALDAAAGAAGRRWWLVRGEGVAWVRLREAGELPAGTCVVPTEQSALRVRSGLAWPDSLLSQLDGPIADEEGAMFYVEFLPDGSLSAGSRRMVVASANEAPGQAPQLLDPAAVQVLRITADGRIEEDGR